MSTPEQAPQYAQAQYYQQQQQAYGQQATGAVPYGAYGQPKASNPIAGGVWGIMLLALGGLLTLIGLITLIISITGDFGAAEHPTASLLTTTLLVSGFVLDGMFFHLQGLSVKKN
jgi:hypothetical protein